MKAEAAKQKPRAWNPESTERNLCCRVEGLGLKVFGLIGFRMQFKLFGFRVSVVSGPRG